MANHGYRSIKTSTIVIVLLITCDFTRKILKPLFPQSVLQYLLFNILKVNVIKENKIFIPL